MSASIDMERLVDEIAAARSDRGVFMNNLKENFNRIKQDTEGLRYKSVVLLKLMGKDRKKINQSLHRQLDLDTKERMKEAKIDQGKRINSIRDSKNALKSDMDAYETDRKADMKVDKAQRINSIRDSKNALKSDMDAYETDRKADMKVDKAQRLADLRKMQEDTQANLKQIHISQKKMGDALSTFLKVFISDVKANETTRKSETNDFLADIKANGKIRKSEMNDFLGSVKAEMSALSTAWGNVYSNAGINKPEAVQEDTVSELDMEIDTASEPDIEMDTASELDIEIDTASEPDIEIDTVSESDMEKEVGEGPEGQILSYLKSETDTEHADGPIKKKVMSTLFEYADGLKMTQLAELLDIEQWRILIPVMRDLLENNEIKKEDSLYFTI